MGKQVYLSEIEIFVTSLWLENSCVAADESEYKTIIEKVLSKLK